jgi:hypothetical protein
MSFLERRFDGRSVLDPPSDGGVAPPRRPAVARLALGHLTRTRSMAG